MRCVNDSEQQAYLMRAVLGVSCSCVGRPDPAGGGGRHGGGGVEAGRVALRRDIDARADGEGVPPPRAGRTASCGWPKDLALTGWARPFLLLLLLLLRRRATLPTGPVQALLNMRSGLGDARTDEQTYTWIEI